MPRRHRPKYQLPGARRRRRGRRYGVPVLLALALLGGWVWLARHARTLPTNPITTTSTRVALTNRNQAALPSTANAPQNAQKRFPRPVEDVLEAQIALARQGLCPGSIEGLAGPQTLSAVAAFQRREFLPVSGNLDPTTLARLFLSNAPYTSYSISREDLARLQPLRATWVGKSQQTALEFETVLEMLAERAHAHPSLIRRLNPTLDWNQIAADTTVRLPAVPEPEPEAKAAFVVVHLAEKTLEAFGTETNLVAHFPCSIARSVEKRPVGLLRVVVVIPNPNYTFDPALFPESPEASGLTGKLVLPAGPNNPVGLAWIGLDKPGYGIHGTPNPEQVGHTESHGCFRLANWNAAYLLKLAWIGMPVYVER
jgi:lipoprotein-anchoring transpeptidase ErfK/SrfK